MMKTGSNIKALGMATALLSGIGALLGTLSSTLAHAEPPRPAAAAIPDPDEAAPARAGADAS